jgi:hypothetical protein
MYGEDVNRANVLHRVSGLDDNAGGRSVNRAVGTKLPTTRQACQERELQRRIFSAARVLHSNPQDVNSRRKANAELTVKTADRSNDKETEISR